MAKSKTVPVGLNAVVVLNTLASLMEEARGKLAQNEAALDRVVMLKALAEHLGVKQRVLLQRGFERAYRQLVEGV